MLRLPSGPITAAAVQDNQVRKPWSFTSGENGVTVYLPDNIESLADDPLALACIAACKCINPIYVMTSEKMENANFSKQQSNYLSGIAWALNTKDLQAPDYHQLSGSLGHGYYYVAHKILQHRVGSTWWAKGSPWHFTKGLIGKAWSKASDAQTICASALISKACTCLTVKDETVQNWKREGESFRGKELRKALKISSHVISEDETSYLKVVYGAQIKAYENALDAVKNLSMASVPHLSSHFQKVGKDLQELAVKLDKVTSHRMSVLYPKEKGKKKSAQVPIGTRINELEWEKRIFTFDPSIWGGYAPFRATFDDVDNDIVDVKATIADYKRRLDAIKAANSKLGILCEGFFATYVDTC
jgi:hypothetical protein